MLSPSAKHGASLAAILQAAARQSAQSQGAKWSPLDGRGSLNPHPRRCSPPGPAQTPIPKQKASIATETGCLL